MVSKRKIVVIDDDLQILNEIQYFLENQGYEVATATDGVSGLELVRTKAPDLVVLDITFPVSSYARRQVVDGVEVLRMIRESSSIPVIMLSRTNISAVKVMALNIGADDYVSKPFKIDELNARIKTILRRTDKDLPAEKVLHFSRLQLDPGERSVWKDDHLIELTSFEFDILYMLAKRPRHVFSRDSIMEYVWKNESNCVAKVVDVHIGHIRKKIEDIPSHPTFIVTVRGIGYRFVDDQ